MAQAPLPPVPPYRQQHDSGRLENGPARLQGDPGTLENGFGRREHGSGRLENGPARLQSDPGKLENTYVGSGGGRMAYVRRKAGKEAGVAGFGG